MAQSFGVDVPNDLAQVHFVVRSPSGDSLIGTANPTAVAPTGQTSFAIPSNWAGSPVTISASAIAKTGPVRWSGRTANDGATATLTLYPGPPANLGITQLEVAAAPGAPTTIQIGDTVRLAALTRGTDGAIEVYWGSADPNVLVSLGNGWFAAKMLGTAKVIAAAGPRADTVAVTVTQRIASIRLRPDSVVSSAIGDTVTFVATAYGPTGTVITTPALQWAVADSAVASPLGGGRFLVRGPGRATVTVAVAARPDIQANAIIRVVPTVTSLAISPPGGTLSSIGDTLRLVATAADARGHSVPGVAVVWSSRTPQIASIDARGTVTARAPGTTTITAAAGATTATVTVEVAPAVATLTVSPKSLALRVNDSAQIAASARDRNGNTLATAITWSSRDAGVATVSSEGLVRARHAGRTAVIASDGGLSDSVTVAVEAPPLPTVTQLVVVSGNAQTAPAGSALPLAVTVRAASGTGAGVPAQPITWHVVSGGGSLNATSTTTDSSGLAAVRWTLGTQGTTQTVEAALPALPNVPVATFYATATSGGVTLTIAPRDTTLTAFGDTLALRISALDGFGHSVAWSSTVADTAVLSRLDSTHVRSRATGQTWVHIMTGPVRDSALVHVLQDAANVTIGGSPGSLIVGDTAHLTTAVTDRRANPVVGVTTTWSSSDPTVASAGTDGTVIALRTGDATITATAGHATGTVAVHVSAPTPAALEVLAGQSQNGPAGLPLAIQPTVRVKDARGRVLAGATVTWTATADGSAGPATSATDSSGVARTTWTLRSSAGFDTLRASVAPLPAVMFTATATVPGGAVLSVTPRDTSLGAFGDTLALRVVSLDSIGRFAAWTSVVGDSTVLSRLDSTRAIARANGQSWIRVTSGSKRDSVLIHVAQVAATVAIAGAPASMTAGDTAHLSASITDRHANPVIGATPSWSSSDATVVAIGSQGAAIALRPGDATITASSGTATRSVAIHVDALIPASVAITDGQGQTGDAGAALATPPAVVVRDARNRPIAGVTVTWTATGDGSASPTSSATDSAGVARTTWTLRTVAGADTITARVGALAPAVFTATAAAGAVSSVNLVIPADSLGALGDTAAWSANARDSHGNAVPATFVWSSSAPGVATVDSVGQVVAVSPGTSTITAAVGAINASHVIRVQPRIVSVSFDSLPSNVIQGDTVRLSATARDARNNPITSAPITWTASDTTVLRALGTGTYLAIVLGSADVQVAAGGASALTTITVSAGSPTTVLPVSTPVDGPAGQTLADSAAVVVLNAHGRALANVQVSWYTTSTASASPTVSFTSANGYARTAWTLRAAPGVDTLRARVTGVPILRFIVTATGDTAASVTVTGTPDTLRSIGDTLRAHAVVRGDTGKVLGSAPLTWSSNAPGVATVDANGTVTAVTAGSATISARSGSVTGAWTVVVSPRVTQVQVTPQGPTAMVGDTVSFTGTPKDARGNPVAGATVTWTSSTPGVAAVDANGRAVAVSPGTTTITATSGSVTGTSTLTVSAGVENVTAYGAKGDGTTLDDDALQAAINAATTRGRTLVIPCGTYMVSRELVYSSLLTVKGAGACSVIKNAPSRAGPYTMLAPQAGVPSTLVMDSVTIDQNFGPLPDDGNSYAISVNGTSNSRITNSVFHNIITMAVWADSRGGVTTTGLQISHDTVTEANGDGFSVFGAVTDFHIDDNLVQNTKDDAIALQSVGSDFPARGTISRNRILSANRRNSSGSTPHGILSYDVQDLTIAGNYIDGTVADGIGIVDFTPTQSKRIVISNNMIRNGGVTVDSASGFTRDGIKIEAADSVILLNNGVARSFSDGILLLDVTRLTMSGNTITQSNNSALLLNGVDTGTIDNNIMQDNGAGAHAGSNFAIGLISDNHIAANLTFTSNLIRNLPGEPNGFHTEYGVFVIQGAAGVSSPANVHLTGNTFIVPTIFGGMNIGLVSN